jgi:hypothetical protein
MTIYSYNHAIKRFILASDFLTNAAALERLEVAFPFAERLDCKKLPQGELFVRMVAAKRTWASWPAIHGVPAAQVRSLPAASCRLFLGPPPLRCGSRLGARFFQVPFAERLKRKKLPIGSFLIG